METACPRDEECKMIKDAASGPEMLECLAEKGHREILYRCLEELGDCKISDVMKRSLWKCLMRQSSYQCGFEWVKISGKY